MIMSLLIFCLIFFSHQFLIGTSYVKINSNSIEILSGDRGTFFSFFGDVQVSSGEFILTSDTLEVSSKDQGDLLAFGTCKTSVDEIRAIGNVKFVKPGTRGSANEIIIYPIGGTMTLIGDAEIADSNGVARGDKLSLKRGSKSLKAESSGRSVISISDGKILSKPSLKEKDDFNKIKNNGD